MTSTSDPAIRRWWLRQLELREDAVGGPASAANRKRRAEEAAAHGETLPRHIQGLVDVLANSEAPVRPEVRAEVEAELKRRMAHFKEKNSA